MRTFILFNSIALVAVLTLNYLSVRLPLNGATPGALSDLYPNLFTPAGFTFSIWGIIYLLLIAWAGIQWTGAAFIRPFVEKTGWLFVLTCVLNMAWLFAWHWKMPGLSVLVMTGLLGVLIALNEAIRPLAPSNDWQRILTHLPFGVYQGWISVAIIANVTAWLVSMGWRGGDSEVWITAAMIGTGAGIAALMLWWKGNYGHALAVTWALYGIYSKRDGAPELGSDTIAWVAKSAAILLGMLLLYKAIRWISPK